MPLINLQLRNRLSLSLLQILCDCDLLCALLLRSSMLLLLLLTNTRTIIKIPIYYRPCFKLSSGKWQQSLLGGWQYENLQAKFWSYWAACDSVCWIYWLRCKVCLLDVNYLNFSKMPQFACIQHNSNTLYNIDFQLLMLFELEPTSIRALWHNFSSLVIGKVHN